MGYSPRYASRSTAAKMERYHVERNCICSLLIYLLEQTLESHDLAIPIPQSSQHHERQFFRMVVLSHSDMQDLVNAMARIERLYHHSGGSNTGIVFLLHEKSPNRDGTVAFMKLQARYIIPFSDLTITD